MNTNNNDIKHIARAKIRLAKLETRILHTTLAMKAIENEYVSLRWHNVIRRYVLERRYARLDSALNNDRNNAIELRRYIANVQSWMLTS